jgi:S-adenosylmethionine uptake transporter
MSLGQGDPMKRPGPILVYVIGIAFFCGMDAFMKALVADNSAVMASFWRYAAAFLFALPFWLGDGRPRVTREMLPMHLLRAVVGSISAVSFFYGVAVLPLAEAVTIAFIAPLLIPLFAALFLKERLEPASLAAGLAGFGGVLVATGIHALAPEQMLGVGAVLLSAVTYALVIVITRLRAARDGPALLTLLNAGFSSLLIGAVMAVQLPPGDWLPTRGELPLVLGVGITGAIALQLIARAYAAEQAQRLAPYEYTALFWAALLGLVFFGEPVALRTLAGAAIIIAACLWQARRARAPA